MTTYIVPYKIVLSSTIEVEADSEKDAFNEVMSMEHDELSNPNNGDFELEIDIDNIKAQ